MPPECEHLRLRVLVMEVRHLPAGERAPLDSDRIVLNVRSSGETAFIAVRKMDKANAHMVSPNTFESEELALAAALDWASENGVELVYVERTLP